MISVLKLSLEDQKLRFLLDMEGKFLDNWLVFT